MIIVLAKAIPNDESAKEKVIDFAQDLITKSKLEDGNVDYNLFANTGDGSLMFVEQWESKEILGKHLQTEHFLNFGKNIDGLLAADLEINVFDADATDL
ncbi:ABC transporter permease [Methanobrevibacter sp. YE315]|uniref:putative quinol monooxygenase n=1 Tax=Methanobrevibacter sp. YE315 TaxID=1609968 RepID=UPI000764DAE9|nr:putative quinol monooxygenase [Methanobrevibacter sp. YE315]AMD17535.1 ABC transporter permease [Methanobrevibacter sp. YE315]